MQRYGIIQNGELLTLNIPLDGYKPVIFAEIADFDQSTQYIVQLDPVDNGDHIFIGNEIKQLELDNNEGEMFEEGEFI